LLTTPNRQHTRSMIGDLIKVFKIHKGFDKLRQLVLLQFILNRT